MATLEERVDRLEQGFLSQSEALLALTTGMDRIHTVLTTYAGYFEAIDRRFEAMDARFEAIDRRFEAMDTRFDHLEKIITDGFSQNGASS